MTVYRENWFLDDLLLVATWVTTNTTDPDVMGAAVRLLNEARTMTDQPTASERSAYIDELCATYEASGRDAAAEIGPEGIEVLRALRSALRVEAANEQPDEADKKGADNATGLTDEDFIGW